jgi:hypothetical protein
LRHYFFFFFFATDPELEGTTMPSWFMPRGVVVITGVDGGLGGLGGVTEG